MYISNADQGARESSMGDNFVKQIKSTYFPALKYFINCKATNRESHLSRKTQKHNPQGYKKDE